MTNRHCGPTSLYTAEQERWLGAIKVEFIGKIKDGNSDHKWETKWKEAKAREFVETFKNSLDSGIPLDKWKSVRFRFSMF